MKSKHEIISNVPTSIDRIQWAHFVTYLLKPKTMVQVSLFLFLRKQIREVRYKCHITSIHNLSRWLILGLRMSSAGVTVWTHEGLPTKRTLMSSQSKDS